MLLVVGSVVFVLWYVFGDMLICVWKCCVKYFLLWKLIECVMFVMCWLVWVSSDCVSVIWCLVMRLVKVLLVFL